MDAFAHANQLFGAQDGPSSTEGFVGLCYVADDNIETWELGGLIVQSEFRSKGIGTTLARVAIAHTMVYVQPRESRNIVAYVDPGNLGPRSLLSKLGFVSDGSEQSDGVVWDRFRFTHRGLKDLSSWFDDESRGIFDDRHAKIDLGPAKLDDLRNALRDQAERYR